MQSGDKCLAVLAVCFALTVCVIAVCITVYELEELRAKTPATVPR